MGLLNKIKSSKDIITEEKDVESHLCDREKTSEDISLITNVIKDNLMCSSLNDYEIEALATSMRLYKYNTNEIVTKQGAIGSHFFIISTGRYQVDIGGNVIKVLEKGSSFGEISLIRNTPRTATITTVDEGPFYLWAVNRQSFRDLLKQLSVRDFAENRKFIDCVIIFEMLNDSQKTMITNALVEVKFNPGDNIVVQGDRGDVLFILKTGEADVIIDGKPVRRLTKGSYFGERALLYDEPRSATIKAVSETTCITLTREILNRVLGNFQHVLFRNIMMESLQQSEVLRQFTCYQLTQLIESATVKDFMGSRTILDCEMLLTGIRFFIVLEGTVEIYHNNHLLGEMNRGDSFGEEYVKEPKVPFSHKVIATSNCKLAFLTGHALLTVLGGQDLEGKLDYNNKMSIIKKMYIFRYLSDKQCELLIKAFKTVNYNKDDFIITQGELGDSLYIIKEGEVTIKKDGNKIRNLGKHDYFGERALLYDEPRSASVVCYSNTALLWVVAKPIFLNIIQGPMLSHLEDRIKMQDVMVSFDDLQVIQIIGKGTFGTVKLVENKKTHFRYALKCVSRKCIGQLGQQSNIKLEREIMAQIDHPFIIRLVRTFKDEDNLYFLTELVTGGELYEAIRKLGLLCKAHAQFYLGSIILAIEYLHERQIAYRDLKPENILLDHQGYIKLIDFGCAKKITSRSFTLMGTPHYMAPEIILGKGYTCTADIWSFGICLYEFICGPLPFGNDADDQIEIFRDVLTGQLTFPDYVTDKDAINLIKRLLCRIPEVRIGSSINGYNDIKEHSYFKDFDWDKLIGHMLEPPLIPEGEVYCGDQILDDNEDTIAHNDDGDEPAAAMGDWDNEF